MANSSFFGYSYFSGANVFVKLNGIPALETAGITYSVQESTAPIYGYSSRIFDAVAMGQKIVRGSFVINFIAPNYIARMIELGKAKFNVNVQENFGSQELQPLQSELDEKLLLEEALKLEYKEAQQKLLEELSPAIRELESNEIIYKGKIDPIKLRHYEEQIKIIDDYHKKAGDGSALIGYDSSLRGLNSLLQEKAVKDLLAKNSEMRERELEHLDQQINSLIEAEQNTSLYKNIIKARKDIEDKKEQLRLDYEAKILPLSNSIGEIKKRMQLTQSALIDSRKALDNALDRIRDAKNFNSVQEAIAGMNILETVNSSYYLDSQQSGSYGVNNTNDIGLLGPFNIDIQFAEEYTIRIMDAFLTSRGSMIQIDENAIVEEYSFFARDIKYF